MGNQAAAWGTQGVGVQKVTQGLGANDNIGVRKMRDFYAMKPDAPIYQTEFGYYVLDRWKAEGHVPPGAETVDDLAELFGYDPPAQYSLGCLGWCEAGFYPVFEEKILEDQGDYEIVQDFAGRAVKCFKNRRSGFMPEYVGNPVKDRASWEESCLWRMDPSSPGREPEIKRAVEGAREAAAAGQMIVANIVGGYMYLRALMGPVNVMYIIYDDPGLVNSCMEAWFGLADAVYAKMQEDVTIDEIYIAEDICYNHGFLIGPEMIREFLFPYYKQLFANIRRRQEGRARAPYFKLDTDGFSDVAIPLYKEIGLDYLAPFEVASGCDVVRTAKEYPDLRISGGFDKRILAESPEAIDREIDRIMPFMKKRGGYYPTCDHGIPAEVSFENYVHYRRRMLEFA
jgi:uroporphyrinogen decarboxylase